MRLANARDDSAIVEIRNWLEMAHEFPTKYRRIVDRACQSRERWLPALIHLSTHESTRAAQIAFRILVELVSEAENIRSIVDICKLLPPQASVLAEVSAVAIEKFFRFANAQSVLTDRDAAMLLGNVSHRCLQANRADLGLRFAKRAVALSRALSKTRLKDLRIRARCLMTFEQSLSKSGAARQALLVTTEACSITRKLGNTGLLSDRILAAMAQSRRAALLAAGGMFLKALTAAREAEKVLATLPKLKRIRREVAHVELELANVLRKMEDEQASFRHAHKAERVFRVLAAQHPDEYLPIAFASTQTYLGLLLRRGEYALAYDLARTNLERLAEPALYRHYDFDRMVFECFIGLSASAFGLSRGAEALRYGQRALSQACRLCHKRQSACWGLVATANKNLFTIYRGLNNLNEAAKAIRAAGRAFGRLAKTQPEARTEQERAFRDLALLKRSAAKPLS